MSSIADVQATLQCKFQVLNRRLERIESDRRRAGRILSAGFAEQAVECENDEVLDRLAECTAAELAQVRHALERVNAGRYGTCERCRRPIDPRRLDSRAGGHSVPGLRG